VPTIKHTFNALAREAYASGARDLHLVPEQHPRYRGPDRTLVTLEDAALSAEDLDALARMQFGASGFEQLERSGVVQRQVRFDLTPDTHHPLRATLTRSAGGCSLSYRFLLSGGPLDLEALRVPAAVTPLLEAPTGLVVVAGPHESGKTTTLHALLGWINAQRAVHLCTVEDPLDLVIEPKQALVQQREVGVDVPDVAAGIAAAREQDADVIAVAALTSLDSLTATLHAAETGHLVLTQVHANSAQEALERIVEATPETMHALVRRSLSECLLGVCWQRLLPRQPRGRVAAYQLLLPDAALREAILSGAPLGEGGEGSVQLEGQLAALEAEGLVTAEDAAAARTASR